MATDDKVELKVYYRRPGYELIEPREVRKLQEVVGEFREGIFTQSAFKISPTVVVKHSHKVKFKEAQNMLFIEQNTNIPVPKVYAFYSHPMPEKTKYDEGEEKTYYEWGYIFMDFVPGETVEDVWDRWDQATRTNVENELKDYIQQLRSIPGGDYIGSLDRGPVTDITMKYHGDDHGPFNSEREFNLALRKIYVQIYDKESLIESRLDGLLNAHKHRIVFTHNDLHKTNVMINDGHISGIIDWCDSGWFPDYWEYTGAIRGLIQNDSWNTILDNAIGRPYCEVVMMDRLKEVLM